MATSGPVHGRYATYVNHGCRCEQCRRAQHAYYEANRERILGAAKVRAAALRPKP